MKLEVSDIEFQMQSPDFWQDHKKAGELGKELSSLKQDLLFWENVERQVNEYSAMSEEELLANDSAVTSFKKQFDSAYTKLFLSGKHDKGNALLYIFSGAGGVDAQDWASMLLRMYQKYCQRSGYTWMVLDHSMGEQGGIKSVTVEIIGPYAYGYLRAESGVHRLVRISPFSAKQMRHTSFALVDVLPAIEDVRLEINEKDIEMEAFRSSGAGGQNVNKVSTAVRIKHIPTGIAVAIQSERSQAQNREKAMQILKSKLLKLMEDAQVKELEDLSASNEPGSIEWGNQIRSYVLNPYKMVKDHRTGTEASDPDKVLDGDLGEFIASEIATKT